MQRRVGRRGQVISGLTMAACLVAGSLLASCDSSTSSSATPSSPPTTAAVVVPALVDPAHATAPPDAHLRRGRVGRRGRELPPDGVAVRPAEPPGDRARPGLADRCRDDGRPPLRGGRARRVHRLAAQPPRADPAPAHPADRRPARRPRRRLRRRLPARHADGVRQRQPAQLPPLRHLALGDLLQQASGQARPGHARPAGARRGLVARPVRSVDALGGAPPPERRRRLRRPQSRRHRALRALGRRQPLRQRGPADHPHAFRAPPASRP